MTTIEISASDFIRKDNAGLVRLLQVVQKAGPDGISTRKLCERTFGSRSYGLEVIKRADSAGYITRTGKYSKKGGGRKRLNYLTANGKKLLLQLNE
jgi:hypothetical protein